MPIEVADIRLGLLSSTIQLKVFDPAAPESSKGEVFAVEDASADISIFGLATRRIAPKSVELHGVNLTLHVSADGNVITTLPKYPEGSGTGTFPSIALTNGQLTIRQVGRPEFTLQNLNVTVSPSADRVTLSGTIDDTAWSKWTVTGDISREHRTGFIELATEDGPLTLDKLRSIPFVPPAVWQHVNPEGRAAAIVRLWTDSTSDVHYTVDIKPKAAALTLPDANVTLANVTGLINVSGAKVKLAGTRAELAGGNLSVEGDFDFGPEPTVVNLRVAAERLDIKKLPPEWNLPKDIEGKLKGNADLALKIHSDSRIEPSGGGTGIITDVKILGFPGDDIPIHLRRRGNQYEFQQPQKKAAAPQAFDFLFGTVLLLQGPKTIDPPTKDDKKEPSKGDDPVLDATIRFRDIDIAELLAKLNVKLDYKINGKVSAEATIMVPITQAVNAAAYRFTGKVSSPALVLEGLTIRDLTANMTYQDGTFTLTDLSGKIDQVGEPTGMFRGTLSAATSPPGEVGALTVDRIPLGEVLKAVPGFALNVKGMVSGKVAISAPYEKLTDSKEWSGSSEVFSKQLIVEGRRATDIRLAARVAKGVLAFKRSNGDRGRHSHHGRRDASSIRQIRFFRDSKDNRHEHHRLAEAGSRS